MITSRIYRSTPVIYNHLRLYSGTHPLSSAAQDKLRDIMEDYRAKNYSQTIPTRFVKTVLKYTDTNKDGMMQKSEFIKFLENIGASEKLTKAEIDEIMDTVSEMGGSGEVTEVSIDKVQKVFLAEMTKK